jgi:hypothetical protein
MKTSEDITKSIREIGRDVDEICLRFVGRGVCQVFDRRYANRLVDTLYDLNLKSWEIVDVQRKSTPSMISQLNIYLQLNCNHQTNIFGDVVEVLLDSFWK